MSETRLFDLVVHLSADRKTFISEPCPVCKKKHGFGAGSNPEMPIYGLRTSRCPGQQHAVIFNLVPPLQG